MPGRPASSFRAQARGEHPNRKWATPFLWLAALGGRSGSRSPLLLPAWSQGGIFPLAFGEAL